MEKDIVSLILEKNGLFLVEERSLNKLHLIKQQVRKMLKEYSLGGK